MSAWLKVGVPLSFVGVVVASAVTSTSAITACSSNNNSSGSSSSGGTNGTCAPCPGSPADTSNGGNGTPLPPGTFPDPTCCLATEGTCASNPTGVCSNRHLEVR